MAYYTIVELPPVDLIEEQKNRKGPPKPGQQDYRGEVLALAALVKGWSYVVTRNDTGAPVCVCETPAQAQHMEMMLNDKPLV